VELFEIREILSRERPRLEEEYGVESLEIFGSWIRGRQQPGSDLDLLVSFRRPIDLFRYVELENDLSNLLGIRVDLVMKDALKPKIGRRILSEAVPV